MSMCTVDYTHILEIVHVKYSRNPRLSVSRAVQIVEHHLVRCRMWRHMLLVQYDGKAQQIG